MPQSTMRQLMTCFFRVAVFLAIASSIAVGASNTAIAQCDANVVTALEQIARDMGDSRLNVGIDIAIHAPPENLKNDNLITGDHDGKHREYFNQSGKWVMKQLTWAGDNPESSRLARARGIFLEISLGGDEKDVLIDLTYDWLNEKCSIDSAPYDAEISDVVKAGPHNGKIMIDVLGEPKYSNRLFFETYRVGLDVYLEVHFTKADLVNRTLIFKQLGPLRSEEVVRNN